MRPPAPAGLDRLALAHALTDGCDDVRRMPLSVSLSLLRLSRHCPSLATRLRPVLEPKLSLLLPKLPPSTRARVIRDMAATPIVLRTPPPLGAELSGAAAAGCCRGAGVSDAGRARREHGGGAAARGAGAPRATGAWREPEGSADAEASGGPAEPHVVREPALRFSDHPIWSSSESYYVSRGLAAFSSGEVPHHISTSRFLALGLAAVVAAFWADASGTASYGEGEGEGQSEASAAEEEATATWYVLELGCGTGRLGLQLATELRRRHHACPGKCCVVLVDLDPSAALRLCATSAAAPLVSEGWLDVASLQADEPAGTPLQLLRSGRRIAPGSLRTPLVLLGCYFFDSLPVDVFRVTPGAEDEVEALQGLQALQAEGREDAFAYVPCEPASYFDKAGRGEEDGPPLGRLLASCLSEGAATAVREGRGRACATAVPTAAMRCLWRLAGLRHGAGKPVPLLLLVGDKVVEAEEAGRLLRGEAAAGAPLRLSDLKLFDRHAGAVSHALCLPPLAEALRLCCTGGQASQEGATAGESGGGVVVLRSAPLMEFDVATLLWPKGPWDRTRRAFAAELAQFGPSEWQVLQEYASQLSTRRDMRSTLRRFRPWLGT